jgi:hypothetical protein
MMLSTEAIICEIPEDKKSAQVGGPGACGGMEDMY